MPPLLQLAALILAASNLLLALGLLLLGWLLYRNRKQLRRATRRLVVMGRTGKLMRQAIAELRRAYMNLKRKQTSAGWGDSKLFTQWFNRKQVDRQAVTAQEIPLPNPPPLPSFANEDTPFAPVLIPDEAISESIARQIRK
jgi:hypothetical protein